MEIPQSDLLLHSAIKSHDDYFSNIISMIPRDLYQPEEEDDEEVNKRYQKHRKLPLTPTERKNISKKKIKEKYEPKIIENEDSNPVQIQNDFSLPAEDLGIDGLKKRLQERINSLRAARGDGSNKDQPKQPREKKDNNHDNKLSNNNQSKKKTNTSTVPPQVKPSVREELLRSNDEVEEEQGDIEFSKFVENTVKSNEPGKPGSKTKRLQRMLEEADKKRQRLEDLKSQGKEGNDRILAEKWSEVIQEASGENVVINTTKIKKALKRRAKNKEKSASQWAERISEVETSKAKKQEKREENILKRKRGADYVEPNSQNKPKSIVSIANQSKEGSKNIKKDSNGNQRAGFEGKKKEFLNRKSS